MIGGLINVAIGRLERDRSNVTGSPWPYLMIGQMKFDRQLTPVVHTVRFGDDLRQNKLNVQDMHAIGALAILSQSFRICSPYDDRPLLPETRIASIAEALGLSR